jgi:hypothetical protein
MSNTADVTGGNPTTVWSQSTIDVNAINPIVTFCDIHGGKSGAILLFVLDTTRDYKV